MLSVSILNELQGTETKSSSVLIREERERTENGCEASSTLGSRSGAGGEPRSGGGLIGLVCFISIPKAVCGVSMLAVCVCVCNK